MARSGDLPFNAEVLRWAREQAGIAYEVAAKRINKSPEDIRHWEEGQGQPSLRQARALAVLYDRPFLEFFLPAPPTLPEPAALADFRTRAGRSLSASNALTKIQLWAEQARNNALDLYDLLGEEPTRFPEQLFASLEDAPETHGERARELIGPSVTDQRELPKNQTHLFPRLLREHIEAIGTIVLRNSALEDEGQAASVSPNFRCP